MAAAQSAGASLIALAETLEQDAEFRRRWEGVQELLSLNVATMLYRIAMTGDAQAQKSFLQLRPIPRRPASADHPPSQSPTEMADDELLAQFQRDAPLLLAQLAPQSVADAGTELPGPVPGAAVSAR